MANRGRAFESKQGFEKPIVEYKKSWTDSEMIAMEEEMELLRAEYRNILNAEIKWFERQGAVKIYDTNPPTWSYGVIIQRDQKGNVVFDFHKQAEIKLKYFYEWRSRNNLAAFGIKQKFTLQPLSVRFKKLVDDMKLKYENRDQKPKNS